MSDSASAQDRTHIKTTDRRPESIPRGKIDDPEVAYAGVRSGPRNAAQVIDASSGDDLTVDRSREHVTHSRGFEWGYGGSGPAQLAFAILLDYYDDPDIALEYYQRFCTNVISQLETDDGKIWTLTEDEIETAVQEIRHDLVKALDDSSHLPEVPA
jgi:hypothetical protein